jgi:uncharacterized membrane protein
MMEEPQQEADSQAPAAPPSASQPIAPESREPDSTPAPPIASAGDSSNSQSRQQGPVEDAASHARRVRVTGVGFTQLVLALLVVLVSAFLLAVHLQSLFEDPKFRGALVSAGLQQRLHGLLAGASTQISATADVSFARLVGWTTAAAIWAWVAGAFLMALTSRSAIREMLCRWGVRFGWLWLFGLFEALRAGTVVLSEGGSDRWLAALVAGVPLLHTMAWGAWLAGGLGLLAPEDERAAVRRAFTNRSVVWIVAALYAITFSTLSILQYRSLMVPHGDSAMYEEHLWNLLHGKGFRSQLDSGRLFFGEHLEVIHVLMLPIYLLFPNLVTLNLCLTAGLASGAIAVRGIARRVSGPGPAADWLAVAYLFYFPLQYLNLEVSLKTFRPENLGVPLLLFAVWALEARRWRTMLALLGLTLLCKEDYAIPVAMLGAFLLLRRDPVGAGRARWLGAGVFAFAAAFLAFVLVQFIPWFRNGPPHYMAYFPELGSTPAEVVANVARDPLRLIRLLANDENAVFAVSLLAPLAFLPLLGIGRVWACIPTLISIFLIRLDDARTPFFHFHAPLVPIMFWAAAEGLKWVGSLGRKWRLVAGSESERVVSAPDTAGSASFSASAARFAAACAVVSGILMGKSPLSVAFYDPDAGLRGYYRVLYSPDGMITLRERGFAAMAPGASEEYANHLRAIGRVRTFERLLTLIPREASVAATDYVRPRFTHYRACHQYGEGGLKPHVSPESIDYIVVDLIGPYSDWLGGQRLQELQTNPERWEVMHWDPEGELFFHVLRAKAGTHQSQ